MRTKSARTAAFFQNSQISKWTRFTTSVVCALMIATPALAKVGGWSGVQGKGPKYPRDVFPLTASNSFVRASAAPDFWVLMPFLTAQDTNSSCSLASVTLVLNGARKSHSLQKNEELHTFQSVLNATGNNFWKKATSHNGGGVSLTQLADLLPDAMHANGQPMAVVTKIAVDSQDQQSYNDFRTALRENEKSAQNFMIVNFDQGMVMNDEFVGHFAVVGAYDERNDLVLIMDSDKEWYEPYWVPSRRLFRAMSGGRGYLLVDLTGATYYRR